MMLWGSDPGLTPISATQRPPHNVEPALHLWLARRALKIAPPRNGANEDCDVPRYDVFGYTLDSDVEFPELDAVTRSRPVSWRVQSVRHSRAPVPGALLGTDTVYDGVQVRSFKAGADLRLVFDDTGTFDVRTRHRTIAWHPGPNVVDAAVRADILGRVMALAAHADGFVALHASAVTIGGRAVAFMGSKFAGKSTLALALVRSGAKLLTDDTLIVRAGDDGRMWAAPGVQRMRLWPDSARALRAGVSVEAGAKPTLDRLTSRELASEAVPLGACYVLDAVRDGSSNVKRDRMAPVHAAVACVRFAKLAGLAGGSIGAEVLDRVARLTRSVPVFTAAVRRDLLELQGVASAFIEWDASDRGVRAIPTR